MGEGKLFFFLYGAEIKNTGKHANMTQYGVACKYDPIIKGNLGEASDPSRAPVFVKEGWEQGHLKKGASESVLGGWGSFARGLKQGEINIMTVY